MSTPKITATMLATVLQAPAAVVVLDEKAGVRLQLCLTPDQADDPDVVVLLDHAGAAGYLRAKNNRAGEAAAAATIDARLALSA